MKPSRKPVVLRPPTRFPPGQVVARWAARRLLAEGPEFEQFYFIGGDFGRFLGLNRCELCELLAD